MGWKPRPQHCYETVWILVSNPSSETGYALTQKIWERNHSLLSPVPAIVENVLCRKINVMARTKD